MSSSSLCVVSGIGRTQRKGKKTKNCVKKADAAAAAAACLVTGEENG